jgi:hypothetical protein
MDISWEKVMKYVPSIGISLLLSKGFVDWLGINDWVFKFGLFIFLGIFIHWITTDNPKVSQILVVIFICLGVYYCFNWSKKDKLTFKYDGDTPAQIMYILHECDAKNFYPHKMPFGQAHKGKNEIPIKASDFPLKLVQGHCVKITFYLVPRDGVEEDLGSFTFKR